MKFIWFKSTNKKTNAPAIVGMLSKNANLEASFRFNPIKIAIDYEKVYSAFKGSLLDNQYKLPLLDCKFIKPKKTRA